MYVFLMSTLSLANSMLSAQAVKEPPQELGNFCLTTRNEYVENVRKAYESQDYKGSTEADVSIIDLSGKGKGEVDLKRTWDNFDSNKRREYNSKNCDEVMKQWGAVSIAEINANASVAIKKMDVEQNKYSENTKRILAKYSEGTKRKLGLEEQKTQQQRSSNDTNATIVTVVAKGAGDIVKSTQDLEKVKINSDTQRKRNEQKLAIEKLKADNQLAIEKLKADSQLAIEKLKAEQKVMTATSNNDPNLAKKNEQKLEIEKLRADNQLEIEKLKADNQLAIEKLKAEQKAMTATSNNDPNLALIQNWGFSITQCSAVTVLISIDGKQYCINATDKLVAGQQYAYNRSNNRFQPVNSTPIQPNDPNLTLLKSWGLTATTCNLSKTFIYIDKRLYCITASVNIREGSYTYNRTTKRLQMAENKSYRPSSQQSSGFK